MLIKSPRGTKDILPSDIDLWNFIEDQARKLFRIYGYREILTPIFEEANLFLRSLGETSDIVQKQLLTLETDKANALALRPEATASIIRAYIEHSLYKTEKFVKLCYIGPMFRGERPQKGRLRQFHHIGAEAIGATNPQLDVELISLAVNLLNNLGIDGYTLKINNLGCFDDRQKLVDVLKKMLKKQRSALCEVCQDRFERNVLRIFDCKNPKCQQIVQELKLNDAEYLCSDCRDYFNQVIEGLTVLKIPYQISHYLVRGLDYYTRTVFEIVHKDLGSQDAIGAGGRYDRLVKDLGGPELGAVGFAFGLERIVLAMPKQTNLPAQPMDVYIATIGKEAQKEAMVLLSSMRAVGISCDSDYEDSSLKSQMRSADKLKARFVILLGEDELKNKAVTLKNMDAGTQEEILENQLIDKLKEYL